MGSTCVRSTKPGQENNPLACVSCVRAVEPGFDQTPHWLQDGSSIRRSFAESEFDKVVRDGHEQGIMEAALESWVYGGHAPVRKHAPDSFKHPCPSSGGLRGMAVRPQGCAEANDGQGQSRHVRLNLYNLPTDTLSAGSAPAFHCGVEVDDCEWSVTGNATGSGIARGAGVFHCIPRKSNGKRYDESAVIGTTTIGEDEVLRIVQELKKDWRQSSFDPIGCNSLEFCQELCNRLGAGPIPMWVKISANCKGKPKQQALLQSACCVPQVMSEILCCGNTQHTTSDVRHPVLLVQDSLKTRTDNRATALRRLQDSQAAAWGRLQEAQPKDVAGSAAVGVWMHLLAASGITCPLAFEDGR